MVAIEDKIGDNSASTCSTRDNSTSSNPNRTASGEFEIFLGRMPLTTTEADILRVAKPFSPIEARVLPRRRYPYLCGFVTFETLETAQGFISQHHMKSSLGGVNPLTVRFSDGKNATKKVFFGSLSMNMTEESLKNLVSPFGTCLAVNILAKKKRSPCGFVTFATPGQAAACIEGLNGKMNDDGAPYYVVKFGDGVANKDGNADQNKSKRGRNDDENNDNQDGGSSKRRRHQRREHENDIPHDSPDMGVSLAPQLNMNMQNGLIPLKMNTTGFNGLNNGFQHSNSQQNIDTTIFTDGLNNVNGQQMMNVNGLPMMMMQPQQVMMNVPIIQDVHGNISTMNVPQMNNFIAPQQNLMMDNNASFTQFQQPLLQPLQQSTMPMHQTIVPQQPLNLMQQQQPQLIQQPMNPTPQIMGSPTTTMPCQFQSINQNTMQNAQNMQNAFNLQPMQQSNLIDPFSMQPAAALQN